MYSAGTDGTNCPLRVKEGEIPLHCGCASVQVHAPDKYPTELKLRKEKLHLCNHCVFLGCPIEHRA